jgi:hypothetical protein
MFRWELGHQRRPSGILLNRREFCQQMPAERRNLKDRRSTPTRCLSRYTFRGRRRAARRNKESRDYYVDRYEPLYLLMIGLILALCVFDCTLSYKIFGWGGSEINRLAAGLIQGSPLRLLLFKLGLTATGLSILLFHKNFKLLGLIRARDVIAFVFAVYLVLSFYEVFSVLSISRILAAA